jgi:glycine/D-amino acid oxidase-like deaminating enzyme
LEPGEHPFPTKFAIRSVALSIEPNAYLDALVRDFVRFGGKIVIRKFDTPRDLMSIDEEVIVNCTGLGSKALFNDDELMPVKGQLTFLIPQPEVNYRVSLRAPSGTQPTANTSANPRSDGVVIGNLMDRGNWSLDIDEDVRRRNLEATARFFAGMKAPVAGMALTRSVPPKTAPDVQSFFGVDD